MAYDMNGLRGQYDSCLETVAEDLKTLKTGRAKPDLVEGVMVEAYGSRMPLKELASIAAVDTHLLLIQPWDKSIVAAIEKALQTGQNQFNPAVDGQTIRIAVPALTGERREELVKSMHQKIESGRQLVRSQRTKVKKEIEDQKAMGGVSEDDIKRELEQMEKVTHEYMDKLENMGKMKEEELRSM